MSEASAATIEADVMQLCAAGDRDLGTARNRDATGHVLERLRSAGLETDSIPFEVPEWLPGAASVRTGGLELDVHAGPFSPSADAEGPLVVVRTAGELGAGIAPGSVLLLADEIASTQFTPRGYPFYNDPAHAAVLDALEAARPLAVLASTSSSAMTGAMSPFPLIEEVGFGAPTAYMTVDQGAALAAHAGEPVAVRIDSAVRPSTGEQPVGRLRGLGSGRIVVSAHVDSKPGTPGAIDNAAGVAVLLAIADLLASARPERTIEFVPFNGEDHVLAPGELAWLARDTDLSDVTLALNIDAPGLRGGPSAYSFYGLDDATVALVTRIAATHPDIAEGPSWPASDHMIFAMRGIPAIAVTSADFETASRGYSHTPADTPDILDYEVLASTARFLAEVIAAV